MLFHHRSTVLILLLAGVASGILAQPAPEEVLILHSYNEGYNWVASINQGLEEELLPQSWDLWYEYLDTKNLDPSFSLDAFAPLFREKYAHKTFSLIVTVDDPAYQFLARHREELFPGVPLVAIGLNGPPVPRLAQASFIVENPDFSQTLELALKQNPNARAVHFVVDRSITGQRIREALLAVRLSRSLDFDWIDAGTADQVVKRVAEIPRGDVLVYVVYFNPQDGYQSNSRILEQVRAVASVPVYAFWGFNLAAGAFGGYLYDGVTMGKMAAQMMKDIQAGQGFRTFDQPSGNWMFDWSQAQTFGMADSQFPLGTEFVHRPPDFWAINRTAAILFVLGFLALLGYTLLIGLHLRSQKTVRRQNEQIISTQRELMHSLGNVIENRSNETASHVQRITLLSLFLADLAGLPELQRRQLELCAPMHDIGKVGIPDEILKKPGLLTPEEFEVMKSHTTLGHSIFQASSNPMIQAAARIALEHHERWDGTGYPAGKAGDEIDLLARIVSVVDVADALLSERSYKTAWSPEKVRTFLTENKGRMFDPRLCQMLLDHWDEFLDRWRSADATRSSSDPELLR